MIKNKIIEYKERKQLEIKYSGRSSDFITPSFIHGCLLNCAYCYMKRNKPEGLNIATNSTYILDLINSHSLFAEIEKPNQTHSKYITYDIGCNEDFGLHHKYHNWEQIFDFFKNNDKIFATFATKVIPTEFLNYNPNNKVRIRFSLMPQKMVDYFEPNTPLIIDRIKAINTFIKAGYDVHINFSPVIVHTHWLDHYRILFNLINKEVKNKYKHRVKAEVIFLTHNEKRHIDNLYNNQEAENLLWCPSIQEVKYSGLNNSKNIRYKYKLKSRWIEEFKELHKEIIGWNTIRYCFNFLLFLFLKFIII